MHARALFTIPLATITLTTVSNQSKRESSASSLSSPPFTLPAYYPAPAAEKRQARVFMASIKIVCIPSHLHPVIYSAFDKHTEWKKKGGRKGVFNLYRSLERVCCACSRRILLLVRVCAHVSYRLRTTHLPLRENMSICLPAFLRVYLYACVYP